MKTSALVQRILFAGLLAGTLDILAAIILLAHFKAEATFKYIASGVFGQAALTGGADMVAWGAFFHYFIATGWAAAYFLIYPHITLLHKNKWISGLLYGGIVVWCLMNLVVVPLSQVHRGPFVLISVLKNMAILSVCIGLPVAWLADRYYKAA